MQHNKGAFAFASAAQYANMLESLILRKLSILQVEKTASIKKKNKTTRKMDVNAAQIAVDAGVDRF